MPLYKCCWHIGAGGGIGRAFASDLRKSSERLILCDRVDWSLADKDSPVLGDRRFVLDFSDPSAVADFSKEAVSAFGAPDLLVVTAGMVENATLLDTSLELVDELYRNNLQLVFLALHAFLSHCSQDAATPKCIVVLSSNAAENVRPKQAFYACLKSAICALVESTAAEYGAWGVRANCISPGTVWVERNDEKIKTKLQSPPYDPGRPLGRILVPKDLRSALHFLIQPNSMVTGQTLVIDGGSGLTAS